VQEELEDSYTDSEDDGIEEVKNDNIPEEVNEYIIPD
jgi:hypothetical protein